MNIEQGGLAMGGFAFPAPLPRQWIPTFAGMTNVI
jgi:hypothetical protein